ncbi:MAG: hypothetical protein HY898_26190 [Deltaproteobacteria bacterium]|nr:hypothetical protein [Deltaproteobacteria bacterium]
MQTDPDKEPLSTSMGADRKQRTLKLALVAGGVVVIAAAGFFVLSNSLDRKAQQKINSEWSRLSRCMIGTEPLAAGDNASVRFRNLQLTAMVLPAEKRAEAGGVPWPARCATHAHAVAEAWKDAGRSGKDAKDLAATAEELAKLLKSGDANPVVVDLSDPVARLWEQADKEHLAVQEMADVPAPLAAARPMTSDSLKPDEALSKTFFGFKNLFEEPNAGDALRFIVEDKSLGDSPFVCTFTDKKAACRKLPASLKSLSGLRLLATTDDGAEPLVFAGNRGSEGVFRSDTAASIDKMYSYGGHVAADGFASVLGWDEGKKELRLLRQSPVQALQASPIKLDLSIGNFFYSTAVLWDTFVVRGVTKKDGIHLFARRVIRQGAEAFGPEQDIGPIPQAGGGGEGTPHITGCRTAEALVVRVEGYHDEFLTFQPGGFQSGAHFTPPVMAPGRGGALTCRNAEATLTQVTRSAAIQVRCSAAGCNEVSVNLEDIVGKDKDVAPREGFLAGADVDGKLLVVWAAGERGGLRMRLAPIEQIAKTADVVVFDDLVADHKAQKLSSLVEMRLLARGRFAVLLLNTSAGVHALRIDPAGKYAPMKIEWAR